MHGARDEVVVLCGDPIPGADFLGGGTLGEEEGRWGVGGGGDAIDWAILKGPSTVCKLPKSP